MNKKTKVVIVYKIFNHYRKPIFDVLNEYVDLTVLHSQNEKWVKSENASYSSLVRSIRYGRKPTQVWLFVLPKLIINNPDVIIHEFTPSLISLHISFLFAKILNIKFIVWGHGYNRNTKFNPSISIKQRFRLWYMKHSNAIIVYGQKGKQLFSNYILNDKIFVAQNTLDTEKLQELNRQFESIGKQEIKKRLNINHEYNLVFIGRLVRNKLPEKLISINSFLMQRKIDVGIHFIGDGEMKERINSLKLFNKMTNVYFHGAINDDEVSGKILFISDLMIMPGDLGLSINHAFCFDCPVVSFDAGPNGPFHGPEVEYILQNKTGYLANSDIDNDMDNWILNYLQNRFLQKSMKQEIRLLVKNVLSKSIMVNGILEAVNFSMKKQL